MKEILTQLFGEAVTDDALKQFNAELGKKFVAKADFNAKVKELRDEEAKTKSLEDEISKLNQTANNGEDVKAELEALKSQIAAEKAQAEADRILAEKTEAIKKRFEAVVGDKKFIHNAVREEYLKRFGEAIELEENKEKADADIFHEMTKDDRCFEGVTAVKLAGGSPKSAMGGDKPLSRAAELAAKYQANLYGVKES